MVNFVAAAYHFCLALPAAFTQPGKYLLAEFFSMVAPSLDFEHLVIQNALDSQAKGICPPFFSEVIVCPVFPAVNILLIRTSGVGNYIGITPT